MSLPSELVLVWAPRGRDADLAVRLLDRFGMHAEPCADVAELIRRMPNVGCAVISAETLKPPAREALRQGLAAQPPWSDFPLILLVPAGARSESALEAESMLGNVTMIEKPVHSTTLVSAISSALRGRRRQYEAREAIHRRDQFLAMLGHELRNPLAAIMLALDTLPSTPGGPGTKQRMIIDRQSRHLARLVDDLLDVARVTSGKVTLKREPLDIKDVVHRCVQGAELAARARATAIRVAAESEPLIIDGDFVRLEEVFNNLLVNAIKYSPEHARIDIGIRRDGGTCVIDVEDTGIGIDPSMIGRVFDLFAQIDPTLDRSQGGLGVGLTLVRSLVELHGGTIQAHSDGIGRGSRFTVRLPLSSAHLQHAAPRLTLVADGIEGTRVALVEDNLDLLDMTKDMLDVMGCIVTSAADGAAGLALLLNDPPDIAFIDIGLPLLDGYQIARELRAKVSRSLYLVAMTGYGQPEDRQRALAAGYDAHLTKPVTADVLRATIVHARAPRARATTDSVGKRG